MGNQTNKDITNPSLRGSNEYTTNLSMHLIVDQDEIGETSNIVLPEDDTSKIALSIPKDESCTNSSSLISQKGTKSEFQSINGMAKVEGIGANINEFSIFPIFKTDELSKISSVYFFYFELYRAAIIMALLLLPIYLIVERLFLIDNNNPDSIFPNICLNCILKVAAITIFRRLYEIWIAQNAVRMNDWTEDKFAVLLENLPIDAKTEEIKNFIDDLIIRNQNHGKVIDIIFLQDCEEYVSIKKKLKDLREKIDSSKRKESDITKVLAALTLIQGYEQRLEEIENNAKLYKYPLGKAIIIFQKISDVTTIKQSLPSSTFSSVFKRYASRAYLRGKLIRVRRISEPADVIFEGLRINSRSQIYKNFLLVLASLIILIIGAYLIMFLDDRASCINLLLKHPDQFKLNTDCQRILSENENRNWLVFQKYLGTIANL